MISDPTKFHIQNNTLINGKPILAGQRVCIAAGVYPNTFYINGLVKGTAAQPIEFTNCGGQVKLTQKKNPITITGGSRHVKVLGNGHRGTLYGFYIGDVTESMGIMAYGKSRDFELAWIHIYDMQGFAAVVAKTDVSDATPAADKIDSETGKLFVQTNTHLHHIKIEKTEEGEGFYIGYYGCAPGANHYRLRGVKLHDNVMLDTGAEGLQVGCADENVQIYNNYIKDAGWNPFNGTEEQTGGLQIGEGTGDASVYNNWVENVQGNCIRFTSGSGKDPNKLQIHFHDNVVKDCANFFYFNSRLAGELIAPDQTNIQSTQALKDGGKTVRINNNYFEQANPASSGKPAHRPVNPPLGQGPREKVGFVHTSGQMKVFPFEFIGNEFVGNGGKCLHHNMMTVNGEECFVRYYQNLGYEPASTLQGSIFQDNVFTPAP